MFEMMLMGGPTNRPDWTPSVRIPYTVPGNMYQGISGTVTGMEVANTESFTPALLITPGEAVPAPNTGKYGRLLTDSMIWQPLGVESMVGTQAVGVAVDDRVLFFGGVAGSYNLNVREYTISTSAWANIGTLTGVDGSLNQASAARLGDWIVIAYGRERGTALGTHLKYHIPTRTVTRLANLIVDGKPADQGHVLSDGKCIYMYTTTTYLGGVTVVNRFQKFDPANNTFTDLASPPKASYSLPCGFADNGRLLFTGIIDGGVVYTTWMAYNPSNDEWTTWAVPPPTDPYIGKKFAVSNNTLWVMGNASSSNRACFSVPLT